MTVLSLSITSLIKTSGKTAVAVALSHLFGFGHTQSDDVKAKKPAPIFLRNVSNLLKTHDVVIADKYVMTICVRQSISLTS